MSIESDAFVKAKTGDEVVHIKDALQADGQFTEAYPLGYHYFDEALKGGVRSGDLVIITGVSGHGKTTLAQNISVNLSREAFPSVWFSYEVLVDNLYAKFQEMGATKLDNFLIYTPKRNTTGNLAWVKEKIREGLEEFGTKFVFIDHIDFLTPTKLSNKDQRRIILRDICQELKSLALDLKVVVFLVAHVKKVQQREVEMQDIAESSGIYQLADLVMSVQRQEEKQRMGETEQTVVTNISVAKILKNRITGEQPWFKFTLENNSIMLCPQDASPKDFIPTKKSKWPGEKD